MDYIIYIQNMDNMWINYQFVVKFGDKKSKQVTLVALALPDAKSSTKRS